MAPHDDASLFGRLALHYKLITREQLQEATAQQARQAGEKKIGELLVELGYITAQQLAALLAAQRDYLARRAAEAAKPAPAPAPVSAPPAPGRGRAADKLLAFAVASGSSDIHMHPGEPARLRVHGALRDVSAPALDSAATERMARELLDAEQWQAMEREGQVDFSYTLPGVGRFRGNAYREQHGIDVVLRAIPPRPPTLEDLGLPNALAKFANFHQGMVLLTGPAGCGKSSTMAAMINLINVDRRDHIITIEDPIEYLHPSKRCLVNQRQVGRHTGSFARALRAALREDPDVIGIGELRDLETVSLALTAAETGHLVIATLHTSSAIRTVNRILGVFPPSQQDQIRTMVSESLRAVVSQRLLPRADGAGRVPALEVLVVNKAVSNLIRENKTFQIRSVLQTGAAHGMTLMDNALADLVKRKIVTREEAARHVEDPARLPAA